MATSARNMAPVKLPLALNAHPILLPLALFALAFAGSLFVLKRQGPPVGASAGAMSSVQPLRSAGSPGLSVAGSGSLEAPSSRDGAASDGESGSVDAAMRASPAAQLSAATPSEPVAAEVPTPGPLAASDELAASLPPPDPPPPDDVAQTIDTLRNGTLEERVVAIQTLAATGHSGPALGGVRQSLRFAAADQDPEIAARAQEAYDSLMTRDEP